MKHIEWDEYKNARLKSQREICFEDAQATILEGEVLDDIAHPNNPRYPNQRILVVKINQYAYLIPYVEDDSRLFLKTMIPSRKATKKYVKEQ